MNRNEHAVLNHLIESCRDSARGCRLAAEQVDDAALKALFTDMADQREQFALELLPHANRLGGDVAHEGSRVAALHRAWMRLEERFLNDDDALVSEVELGDRATLSAYFQAVNGMLPPDTRPVVERQYAAIEAAHDRLPVLAYRWS